MQDKNPVYAIKQSGFDDRLSSVRGMYGSGVYFAQKACKADQYAGQYHWPPPPGSPFNYYCSVGQKATIFLSRVVLGCPYKTELSLEQLRRPPCIEGGRLKGVPCCICSHQRFDSVMAGLSIDMREKLYREFVVYDKQCYPEFCVTYERCRAPVPARGRAREGIVNYVNVDQGYGWIRCSPAEKQFGSDVLITELQDLALGDWVQFDMKRDDHGRAQDRTPHDDRGRRSGAKRWGEPDRPSELGDERAEELDAHRISKQPQQLKTLAELMGEAASSRPSSDPDAVITALKQKRDLRSIGVPLWQPQKASPLLCAYAPAPPPAPSSTAGADAVAADPAVAALVPCVGSPCLQPSGKERGEEILNFMRNGHGSPPLRRGR
eukprot:g28661.t1